MKKTHKKLFKKGFRNINKTSEVINMLDKFETDILAEFDEWCIDSFEILDFSLTRHMSYDTDYESFVKLQVVYRTDL